jgi:hypothetical protein
VTLIEAGDVFVAFARLFRNQPQVLAAPGAVFLRLGQVVNDSFALQMPRQRLPPTAFLFWRFVRFRFASRIAVAVIVILVAGRFGISTPCLPGSFEQFQLLFRQLLAFAAALRFQQLAQQSLILVLLGHGTI